MTRATRSRIEQRLKRKGEKSPFDAGYQRGWAQGRTQLANALASETGFVADNGDVFRLIKMTPKAPEALDPVEAIEAQLEREGIPT